MGQPWVNAFWISEIAMYLIFRLGGFLGISLLVAGTGAVTFYLLYKRTARGRFISAFVILLAALTAAPVWGPRPQIFSFLLLAVLDGWLEKTQGRNTKALWLLIPFFALWANIHGGWIWGFLLLAAYISGSAINNLTGASRPALKSWKYPGILALWTLAAMLAFLGHWHLAIAISHRRRFHANTRMGLPELSSGPTSAFTMDGLFTTVFRRASQAKDRLDRAYQDYRVRLSCVFLSA